jgi:hypothetical protein
MGDELVFALSQAQPGQAARWRARKDRLFGRPGSRLSDKGILHVGDARLPADLRAALAADPNAVESGNRERILQSLTIIRRYTAMDPETGAPRTETLRAMRLIIHDTTFTSRLVFDADLEDEDKAFLAGCARALRRAGSGRNRGRGQVAAELYTVAPDGDAEAAPVTGEWLQLLRQELTI